MDDDVIVEVGHRNDRQLLLVKMFPQKVCHCQSDWTVFSIALVRFLAHKRVSPFKTSVDSIIR